MAEVAGVPADPAALTAELETAHEELRVADEELRAQAEQIEELLSDQLSSDSQRYWLLSMLPVPVLTTDRHGAVVAANAAAAAFLRVSVVALLRKPLQTYAHLEDRAGLRTSLAGVGPEPVHLRARMLPRRGEPVNVQLVVVAEGADRVTWMVLERSTLPEVEPRQTVGLVAAFAELSQLRAETGLSRDVMHRMVVCARGALPSATSISMDLGSPLEPESVASTDAVAARVDGLQVMAGEGPCADAHEIREPVVSGALAEDDRWPRFSARLGPEDVISVLSVPVECDDAVLGAFNCYSHAPDAFDAADVQVAELLAHTAGAVVISLRQKEELRQLTEQLNAALDSRAVIDQAKGVVMADRGCSAEEAFRHLAEISQRTNTKVRDVARLVVEQAAGTGPRPPAGGASPGAVPLRRVSPRRS